jgi:1,2-diacylglycerol 3-beta-glucosyltransferase
MLGILIGVLSLVLIGTGLFYFIATTGLGMLEGRRLRRAPSAPPPLAGDARTPAVAVYFLIPCLNEEAVIGTTITRLLRDDETRVVVVDDGSRDRTSEVVRSVGGERTLLISRRLPLAQQGKGPALNAGLPAIIADSKARGLDPSQVVVCVMDADGELSEGALRHVLPLFDDPIVGGAQLGVRISNRDVNLLTAMQDFEFWGLAATAQLGRVRLGTVSLGGNGQFTRLSALCGLGAKPWSEALTEDLDLALRLMSDGWRLTTTPLASVHQQAVLTFPALIRQRTRWFQGHMACIGHLRRLWASPAMSNLALMEVTAYLLIPWVFILPWSILFHIGLWQLMGRLASAPHATYGGNGVLIRVVTLIAWYLLGFGPSLFGGYLYNRQDRSVGRIRSLFLGHALVLCNYVAFVSCWLAALRSIRGLTGWEKTVRRTEGGLDFLVPAALAAASGRVRGRLKKRAPDTAPVTTPVPDTVPVAMRAPDWAPAETPPRPRPARPPVVVRLAAGELPPPAAMPTRGLVEAKAIVSRPLKTGVASPAPAAMVRARVTQRPRESAPPPRPLPAPHARRLVENRRLPEPALTGRLRVAHRKNDPKDTLGELGARFLISTDVPDMVSTLEEETTA